MQNKITLVLIRHPRTEGNEVSNSEMAKLERPNHLFQPTKDGLEQMENAITVYYNLMAKLPLFPLFIMCSTAVRTKVVANKFAATFGILGLQVIEDSRLNEKWDGILHSLSKEEIEAKYPEQIDLRKKYGWYHYKPFGGENGPDVEVRIKSLLQDITSVPMHIGKTIVLCSHGNWQLLFEKIALGQSAKEVEEARENNPIPNCAISIYDFFPHARLDSFLRTTEINRYAPWLNATEPTYYA
ncbi:MAG: histidine phosphatase family protein [Patescibacteria group bacterium]